MTRETDRGDLDLGPALRKARQRRGLSQAAAAAEIGVSRKTIVRIESGIYVAHANTRAKVRRWLAAEAERAAAEDAAAERGPAERGPAERMKRPRRWPTAAATASLELRRTMRRKAEQAHRRAVARNMARKKRRR